MQVSKPLPQGSEPLLRTGTTAGTSCLGKAGTMLLLEVANLCVDLEQWKKRFGGVELHRVLSDISFIVHQGEVLGIVGESGSGKTTLARAIAGLVRPVSGTIRFNDVELFPNRENRSQFSNAIQLLFQDHTASLDPRMTVEQILAEGFAARRDQNVESETMNLLDEVGVSTSVLSHLPGRLSGGQRQRIALARALAARPELLILDEPTSALDALTQRHILDLIKNLRRSRNLSLIYITHDIASASDLCDQLGILHQGALAEIGSIEKVLRSPSHPFTRDLLQKSHVA